MRHPWKSDTSCALAAQYNRELTERREREARTLASLTGWDVNDIRRQMNLGGPAGQPGGELKWWQRIWERP